MPKESEHLTNNPLSESTEDKESATDVRLQRKLQGTGQLHNLQEFIRSKVPDVEHKMERRETREINSDILGKMEIEFSPSEGRYWKAKITTNPKFRTADDIYYFKDGHIADGDFGTVIESEPCAVGGNIAHNSAHEPTNIAGLAHAINDLEKQYKMLVCWHANRADGDVSLRPSTVEEHFTTISTSDKSLAQEEWSRIKDLDFFDEVINF